MKKILLVGASGFVGRRVLSALVRNYLVVSSLRRLDESLPGQQILVGDINSKTSWGEALIGVDVIIHAAARVHMLHDEVDSLTEFRKVNFEGTLNLARQAVLAGVKRFIFISSIKVNGERTWHGAPFRACDKPAPEDAYGISKLEAEEGLMQLAKESGMEVVVIRPPLVYGPGAKGNFASLVRILNTGVPLPLGAVSNKRSLVGIDNLVDLICRCIEHPAAANKIIMAGDGVDLSTADLLRGISKAMGKRARLFPVPMWLLQVGGVLIGKKDIAQRLLGSLQVDISETCKLLDWVPPYTVEEGLRRCFEREAEPVNGEIL